MDDYFKEQQPSCIMAIMGFSGKVSHFAVIIKNRKSSFCLNCGNNSIYYTLKLFRPTIIEIDTNTHLNVFDDRNAFLLKYDKIFSRR